MSAVRCVWALGATLGEGPLWSAREQALYFVDLKGQAVHRYTPATGATASWSMPEPIGWVIERAQAPGFIAGFRSGFALLELDPVTIRSIGDPEPEHPGNRLKDAKVDAWGRIW
ncbi:MAG: SMP-30/gluconolactonase/LRE family protein, partial [Reyranella sp.]|nr:SMP-30/gluconolactonase/LRE family protein [Reyranella sp.]